MDKNYQDKAYSKTLATDHELERPPLSLKDQSGLSQSQINQREVIIKQLRDQGYKVTEEFSGDPPRHLSKVSAEHLPRKTWWDGLQLLILPFLIFFLGVGFTALQNWTSMRNADEQQQNTTLKTYLDSMSDLLLKQNLAKSKPRDEVSQLARARTLTVLQQLDSERKGLLIQFLSEANLIVGKEVTGHDPIISLRTADLRTADLSYADLSGVVLSGADLRGANLSGAKLSQIDLSYANLRGAHFLSPSFPPSLSLFSEGTNLSDAKLKKADLQNADLRGVDLSKADLHGADLHGAKLANTILKDAQYNTKETKLTAAQEQEEVPRTEWPQGFDPKAAGAIEKNTSP